jgi:hypothetical protein
MMKNEYMMGNLISLTTLSSGAGLAYLSNPAWPWFLAAGFVAFWTTIGAQIRNNDRN